VRWAGDRGRGLRSARPNGVSRDTRTRHIILTSRIFTERRKTSLVPTDVCACVCARAPVRVLIHRRR
jgi:hypothetical protein